MKKNNIVFCFTALAAIMAGVLFLSKEASAMPIGTLLYRTSAKGMLYGVGGKDKLLELDFASASSVLPVLRLNSGHAALYVGEIDGQDMILEAINNGVQLTPAKYFINTKEGEKLVGARFPKDKKIEKIGVKEFQERIQKVAKFFKENKMGYDYEFKSQKGPGDKQWTCVGLTEKIYESLGFKNDFSEKEFVYNIPDYFIDLTVDGYCDDEIANALNQDVFSSAFEYSKISRRDWEKDGYALGKVKDGNRYFFLPYTQYMQGNVLKNVEVDIQLESYFNSAPIRGKTPVGVYVVYVDNVSGGKISNTGEKIKETGKQIAVAVKDAGQTIASGLKSAASATASAGRKIIDFIPNFLQGAGEAARNSSGVLVKGDASSGIPPSVATQNMPDIPTALAATKEKKDAAARPSASANVPTASKQEKVLSAQKPKPKIVEQKIIKTVQKIIKEAEKSQPPKLVLSEKKTDKEIKPIIKVDPKKIEEKNKEEIKEKIEEKIRPPLPIIHYPPSSGRGQVEEPKEKFPAVPSFRSLVLSDTDSLSEVWSNNLLVKSLADIENLPSVEKFALNESGLRPVLADWASSSSIEYNLSSGDGVKTVYAWISYRKGAGVASTSDSIILDTIPPTASLAPLAASYAKTGWTISWSGDDSCGSGLRFFDVEYSTSSIWLPYLAQTASTSDFFDYPAANGSILSFRVRATDNVGNVGAWSEAVLTKIVQPPHLVISEFSTRVVGSAYNEFVELYNPSDEAITVAGWQLQYKSSGTSSAWTNRSGGGLPEIIILSRGYALLAPSGYSGVVSPDYSHSANWGLPDTGGSLRIIDDAGNEIDRVDYGLVAPAGSSLADFGQNGNYAAERKASTDSTRQTLAEGEKWAGNAYDTDSGDDFVVKATSSPQNSSSPLEPNNLSSIVPAAVSDLAVSSVASSSINLSWLSPENANLIPSAAYDLRYVEKISDCEVDFNWDSAAAAAGLPAPSSSAGLLESASVAGLAADKNYCFGLKTFNGYNWSSVSNLAQGRTLSLPKVEKIDVDYSMIDSPVRTHNYYNLNIAFFSGQSFIPRQNNISAISLFGKRAGAFTLRLCEGDWDFFQSVEANWNCDLAGQKLLAEKSFSENTFPACNGNPISPNPCYGPIVFTKLSFSAPVAVEAGKKHFFILSGAGGITLVGTRNGVYPSRDYSDGIFYSSANLGFDADFIFQTSYLAD